MYSSAKDESTSNLIVSKVTHKKSFTLPCVTANAWALIDGDSGELLWGSAIEKRLEIASLTKVMTAYTVINIFKILNENLCSVSFEVSVNSSHTIGTTAALCAGDKLRVSDLLYGLLLPSGNDAAVCLAEGCGRMLANAWEKNSLVKNQIRRKLYSSTAKSILKIDPIKIFVQCMNTIGLQAKLTRSGFSNPTGLSDKINKSSAFDI